MWDLSLNKEYTIAKHHSREENLFGKAFQNWSGMTEHHGFLSYFLVETLLP
jgi:hypothetical protein